MEMFVKSKQRMPYSEGIEPNRENENGMKKMKDKKEIKEKKEKI